MNLSENIQPNAQEYFERMNEANKKAWELSADFMKKDFERQSSYFKEIADSGRSFFENLAVASKPSENAQANTTQHFEAMQKRYSEITHEQAAAFQELQSQLKEIYSPATSSPEAPKTESKPSSK